MPRGPVVVLALGDEMARGGKGRHPALGSFAGEPSGVVDVEMGEENDVHILRRVTSPTQMVQPVGLRMVPVRARREHAILTDGAVNQDRGLGHINQKGLIRKD